MFSFPLSCDKCSPLAHTFRNEVGLNLGENNLSVSIATDYTKRPHVFRILNPNTGLSYLFQVSLFFMLYPT